MHRNNFISLFTLCKESIQEEIHVSGTILVEYCVGHQLSEGCKSVIEMRDITIRVFLMYFIIYHLNPQNSGRSPPNNDLTY
jgi:hypothetical protein